MSEKRFDFEGGAFTDKTTGGLPFYGGYAACLLNSQAETIEVLREWVRKNEMMVKMETRLAESDTTIDKFKELANRRIAALEGA